MQAGPKPTMTLEQEEMFSNYLDHAWYIGLPRTEKMMAKEIQDYIIRKNIDAPYKYKVPGTEISNLQYIMDTDRYSLMITNILYVASNQY